MKTYYWSDAKSAIRGTYETARVSKVILSQKYVTLLGHRLFVGSQRVELELVERFLSHAERESVIWFGLEPT